MAQPFCDHHESVVRTMGEQRLRGLILENEIAKLVAELRTVTEDLTKIREVFASEMLSATNTIRQILDDFRDEIAVGNDPRSEEKN